MSQGEVKNPQTDGRVKNAREYNAREYNGEVELQNLGDLFEHLLQDMLYAENAITKALPKMAKKSANPNLKSAFEHHLEETKDQITTLKRVIDICGFKQEREKCDAIEGLLREGDSLIEKSLAGAVLDSALIAAAQKVEHYEIATYGTLCNMAKLLGQKEAAKLLHDVLEQEKATDEKLTELCDTIEEKAMYQKAA